MSSRVLSTIQVQLDVLLNNLSQARIISIVESLLCCTWYNLVWSDPPQMKELYWL